MNRRIAIRNMALILGSAAVLPSCLNDGTKPLITLTNLDLSAKQQALVSHVAETILPKTQTPGASELGINLFVLKMVDDCYKKADQETFKKGLDQFNDAAKKQYGSPFSELPQKDRTAFVSALDKQKFDDKAKDKNELLAFYRIVKDQTVFGYTTSKYFMTKQIVYELVPGRYNAYYPVKKQAAV